MVMIDPVFCAARPRGAAFARARWGTGANVVIGQVTAEWRPKVGEKIIEDDDLIESFAADRTDDALDIGILPRRSRCSDDFLDRHRLDTITEPYDASRSRSRKRGAV